MLRVYNLLYNILLACHVVSFKRERQTFKLSAVSHKNTRFMIHIMFEKPPVTHISFEKYDQMQQQTICNNNKRFQPQILVQNIVFAASRFIYRKPFRQTNLNIMEGDDGVFDLSVKFNLPQVFYVEHIQIYGVTMMSS